MERSLNKYIFWLLLFLPILVFKLPMGFFGITDFIIPICLFSLILYFNKYSILYLRKPSYLDVVLCLYLFIVLVSMLFSDAEVYELVYVYRLASILFFFFFFSMFFRINRTSFYSLCNAIFVGLLIAVFIGIIFYQIGFEVRDEQQRMWFGNGIESQARAGGILGNTASYGLQIAMLFQITLYRFFLNDNLSMQINKLNYIALFLCLYAIVISSSRGAVLNCLVFLLILLIPAVKRYGIKLISVLFLVLFVVLLCLYLTLPEHLIQYSLVRFGLQSSGINEFSSGRLGGWDFYISVFNNNWLFGVGYKQSLGIYDVQMDNGIISNFVELGIFGGLLYLFFWGGVIFESLKNYIQTDSAFEKRISLLLFASATAFFSHSLTLDFITIWSVSPLFFTLAAVTLRLK